MKPSFMVGFATVSIERGYEMTGWKTFVVFTIIGVLGLVTALEAVDIKSIFVPLVCHVDPAAAVADDCTAKIIKLAGVWTSALGAVGVFLRAVTTSAIFKSLKDE